MTKDNYLQTFLSCHRGSHSHEQPCASVHSRWVELQLLSQTHGEEMLKEGEQMEQTGEYPY